MLLKTDLPDDLDALRAMVVAAHSELAKRDVALAKREDRIAGLENAGARAEAEIAQLNAIIAAFQRHRFGARSEQLDEDQLQLAFEELDAALSGVKASLDAANKNAGTPAPRKTNRGSLPAHLERIEQVVDIEDKACACCGGDLHAIGEDVAERLDVVPATFRVLVTRRPRYGCRACEAAPIQAPAPARIVDAGLPTEALIVQELVSKYADHLPLYYRRRFTLAKASISIVQRCRIGSGARRGG